jgi:hypothetical protein
MDQLVVRVQALEAAQQAGGGGGGGGGGDESSDDDDDDEDEQEDDSGDDGEEEVEDEEDGEKEAGEGGKKKKKKKKPGKLEEIAKAVGQQRMPKMPGSGMWISSTGPRLTREQFDWALASAFGSGSAMSWVPIGKFVEAAGGATKGHGSDFVNPSHGKFEQHFKSRFGVNVKKPPAANPHIKRVPYGKANAEKGPFAMRLSKLKALYGPP